tara:strand:- start:2118 stop:2366 length:249 start_codon:yes stop_codon:yes gene_type:complete
MVRIAGVPIKVTTQLKEKLEELIDGIVNSIDIDELDTNQKLRCITIHRRSHLSKLYNTPTNQSWETYQSTVIDTSINSCTLF